MRHICEPRWPDAVRPAAFLLVALYFLALAGPCFGESQQIFVRNGFNFVGFSVRVPGLDADGLLARSSAITGVYRFDPVTRKYVSRLNLGAGDFDGTNFALLPDVGYIVRSSADAELFFTGDPLTSSRSLSLSSGFNLVEIGSGGLDSGTLMAGNPAIVGVYRYDPDLARFVSHLNLGGGEFDGTPITLLPGRSYYVRCTGAVTVPIAGTPANTSGIRSVRVSDVTQSAATISWETASSTDGRVAYGESAGAVSGSSIDSAAAGTTHLAVLSGLKTETTYYFKVVSGGLEDTNGGGLYNFRTGKTGVIGTPAILYGKARVGSSTGGGATAAVVLISTGSGTWPLGYRVPASENPAQQGLWFVNLGNLKKITGETHVWAEGDSISVEIRGGSLGVGSLSAKATKTPEGQYSFPDVVLGP